MKEDVKAISLAIDEVLQKIVELRHRFHSHPEMGLKEFETARLAAQTLRDFGCDEVIENVGLTGVVALIHGKHSDNGKTVLFRADMDALPLRENTGCPWS